MELHVPGRRSTCAPCDSWGGVEPLAIQREMIRRTIKEHLDKEKRLRPMGVKVLSLFFIDAVDKYRVYDAEGNPQKGVYAVIFEEEYKRWAPAPDYQACSGDRPERRGARGAQRLLLHRQEEGRRQDGGDGEGHQRQHRR
jgi:type III restriction enzyme